MVQSALQSDNPCLLELISFAQDLLQEEKMKCPTHKQSKLTDFVSDGELCWLIVTDCDSDIPIPTCDTLIPVVLIYFYNVLDTGHNAYFDMLYLKKWHVHVHVFTSISVCFCHTQILLRLKKGHLYNTDKIIWQQGCPY